jgi:hypothetical protein
VIRSLPNMFRYLRGTFRAKRLSTNRRQVSRLSSTRLDTIPRRIFSSSLKSVIYEIFSYHPALVGRLL